MRFMVLKDAGVLHNDGNAWATRPMQAVFSGDC